MTAIAIGPTYLQPRVPEGLIHTVPQVRTAEWSDWFKSIGKAPMMSAPLWTIQRKPRVISLKRPLLVRVYAEDQFFFAANETLAIYATGSSMEDAMADFCVHAIHFYNYYRALPNTKVIGAAVQLKKLFQELFVEE